MELPKEVWERLKYHMPFAYFRYQKVTSGNHPGALHNGKLNFKRPRSQIIKPNRLRKPLPTQHDRTVTLRARRIGISIQEYQRRFPKAL